VAKKDDDETRMMLELS